MFGPVEACLIQNQPFYEASASNAVIRQRLATETHVVDASMTVARRDTGRGCELNHSVGCASMPGPRLNSMIGVWLRMAYKI